MISLIINPDSIRVSKSKISTQIFSEIYFQLNDGTFFPEEKWDDFAVVILGWWLQEALSINTDNKHIFNFMDGPYYLEVSLVDDFYMLTFINDRYDEKKKIFSSPVEPRIFFSLLTTNANLLIRNIPAEAKGFKDVLELEKNLRLLQKHARSFSK